MSLASEQPESVDALKAANSQLQAFAATAAHDLREPLRTITRQCQLLELQAATALTGDAAETVASISSTAERMRHLLDSIMVFSGLLPDTPATELDLRQVVSDALQNLDALKASTGVEFRSSSTQVFVRAKRLQLIQLLQNLISNAANAARPSQPLEVTVSFHACDKQVVIDIADNGTGMDESELSRILEPFWRGANASNYTGAGLGLAICQRIAAANNWELKFVSAANVGTTVSIVIPAVPV